MFQLFLTIFIYILLHKGAFCSSEIISKEFVEGYVFWDLNKNGRRDPGERGIFGALVSNGKEVVVTDKTGRYRLPAYDPMIVFVVPPKNFIPPLNDKNQPQFYYIHDSQGSPPFIKDPIEPTGPLPKNLDFPMYKVNSKKSWSVSEKGQCSTRKPDFSVVIIGDAQVYNEKEIAFLRDSLVKEVSLQEADFALLMGDNVGGGNVFLYPRLLSVLSGMGIPYYLIPGNHDMNYEAPSNSRAFDTYKKYNGPTYYAIRRGKVHFIMLNSVYYLGGKDKRNYRGEIEEQQLEWLSNYLKFVPKDNLIVLSMHIPLVSFQDRKSPQHMVRNRHRIYELLKGRKVIVLSGHIHTIEQFLPGEEVEGWGHPTPFHQVLVGAASGSWWTGDFDFEGIPYAITRCGSPRGFLKIEFFGTNYRIHFFPIGLPKDKQMALSFLTPSFQEWYNTLKGWLSYPQGNPPKTINDLPDQGVLKVSEVKTGVPLVINVWNGRSDTKVRCIFNENQIVSAVRDTNLVDPFALRHQLSMLRWSIGFSAFDQNFGPAPPQPLPTWLHTTQSPHLWKCEVPKDLNPGTHKVLVEAEIEGVKYKEYKVFEILP
ncbi:MAG: calcineurin-like phosphoesterase family protein [Caldimicrobium sp.]|nr:calcineurin-like phosphoesterase family protein [Caldimicrobium sp.]MCX7874497.1 calcineurin-like phosphoesterase family protein [Caldimicrobium sp.]MDW8094546.1 calcineurin-like phosphoesterase C-terminal domain-containing protein [Caldimicrobium sp.]